MLLKLLGGAQEVGRSGLLLKDHKNFLFDYGVKLDHKLEYPLIPSEPVRALLLSHAHLDHSGMAPYLYNMMLPVTFGTAPTLELSNLLLDDSLKIARREHRKEKFRKSQVKSFVKHYVNVDYGIPIKYGNFSIEFHDAGHIAGSAIILLERLDAKENRRIVYTGDFKLQSQFLHKGAEIVKSDVLIIESTYAYKDHPDRKELIHEFISSIKKVLNNGGTALVPVFAVGRGQEILSILYENGLADSVYVDGMVRKATRIIMRNSAFINNAHLLKKAVEEVNIIGDQIDRDIALSEPSIILTTAGMLNGGPVLDYITKLNKNSHIFLTGYQIEGTNGHLLLNTGSIIIDGKKRKINTPVSLYDFSAHAGMSDLYKYVRESAPNVVICMHGSEENTRMFAERLRGEGFDAFAPKIGDEIKLK